MTEVLRLLGQGRDPPVVVHDPSRPLAAAIAPEIDGSAGDAVQQQGVAQHQGTVTSRVCQSINVVTRPGLLKSTVVLQPTV